MSTEKGLERKAAGRPAGRLVLVLITESLINGPTFCTSTDQASLLTSMYHLCTDHRVSVLVLGRF